MAKSMDDTKKEVEELSEIAYDVVDDSFKHGGLNASMDFHSRIFSGKEIKHEEERKFCYGRG